MCSQGEGRDNTHSGLEGVASFPSRHLSDEMVESHDTVAACALICFLFPPFFPLLLPPLIFFVHLSLFGQSGL